MKKIIRAIVCLAISVACLFSITACSNGDAAVKDITLMASQNWIKDIDRELFKDFEKQSGIKVNVLVTPDNGYDNLLSTNLSGGGNAIDIFMYSGGMPMQSAGIDQVAVDLSSESWVSNYEPWAKSANTIKDKVYGFGTWGVDYEGILYNKTYFKENNLEVPKTWNEFITLCDTVVSKGKIPFYENINGAWHTQTWFYGFTPEVLKAHTTMIGDLNNANKANRKDFSDFAKVSEGLEQVKTFLGAKNGNVPKYYTNDGQAEDWFGSYPAMAKRENVMLATYSAYPAELKDENATTDEFGMFPIPVLDNKTVVSNGGGYSKFINKNSKKIDACKQLFNFLAKDENLEKYYSARTDLVTASFKGVESVSGTTATTDAIANSEDKTTPVMMMKDILYWNSEMYKDFQGFASGSLSVSDFVKNCDDYRHAKFALVDKA